MFDNLSPGVVASWGSPVPEWGRSRRFGGEVPRHERVYEGEWSLSSSPRDPTPREAYAILSEGVRRWQVEHPEDEIVYLEITRGSPQRLRAQFIHHGHSPAIIALIAGAIATAILWVAAHWVAVLTVSLLLIAIWGVYRIADYFIPEKRVHYDPKCEREFPNYESLVSHYKYSHPDQEPPPPPSPNILEYVKWGIIAVVAFMGFRYVVWPMIKPEEKR